MTGDEFYYQEQLQSIFKDCDIVNISNTEKYNVSLRGVMMTVTVTLNKENLEEYCCQHYYDNRIKRPKSVTEEQSLRNKLRQYSTDVYCGDHGMWTVALD